MAYEVFAHLAYLLTSILQFNVLHFLYIVSVKVNLIEFMNNIKKMLVERSIELLSLVNILILHFCVMINLIFLRIKAKLLYYLKLVEFQIFIDYIHLYPDLESFNDILSKLQSEVRKYKSILDTVKVLLNKIITFLSHIRILKKDNTKLNERIRNFNQTHKTIKKIQRIFSYKNDRISKTLVLLSSLKLERSIQSKSDNNEIVMNLKMNLQDLQKKSSEIINLNIDKTFIFKFNKSSESIKKILKILEIADHEVSNEIIKVIENTKTTIHKLYQTLSDQNHRISETLDLLSSLKLEKYMNSKVDKWVLFSTLINDLQKLNKQSSNIIKINIDLSDINDFQNYLESIKIILKMIQKVNPRLPKVFKSIIGQLLKVETINLLKLKRLIAGIKLLYLIITARVYLLVCTILFYKEIKQTINEMCKSLKFDCCKVSEFLCKCSEVEKYIKSVSSSINECIIKLATSLNCCKGCLLRKELIQVHIKLIGIIGWLKFYVDLMMLEILIFKMIIINLIVMTVSSVLINELIEVIGEIKDIDEAIGTLVAANVWLRAFYMIQLLNTRTILGLSSALNFSGSIHRYYDVLFMNIYWINQLIWVIECYIKHLIVFKFTSVGLNFLPKYISDQFQIITEINNVANAMSKITNRLISINKSITQLNTISGSMDITNWKESATKIRHEIKSVNRDIGDINSQIDLISESVKSISKSWLILKYLEQFLLVLILQVHKEIEKTKAKILGTSIRSPYFEGLIMSVLGPCNKQLMCILGYIGNMWLYMRNLIKIVKETILLIYKEMVWLKGLTTKLKEHVDNIDRGVVDVECAIEGVARNFMQCSTISSINGTFSIISYSNKNIDIINDNFNMCNIGNINNLINNDKHYMCD